jgi:hypothetical protein
MGSLEICIHFNWVQRRMAASTEIELHARPMILAFITVENIIMHAENMEKNPIICQNAFS